jgi:hypothetical protein
VARLVEWPTVEEALVQVRFTAGVALVQVRCTAGVALVQVRCTAGVALVQVRCTAEEALVQVRFTAGVARVQVRSTVSGGGSSSSGSNIHRRSMLHECRRSRSIPIITAALPLPAVSNLLTMNNIAY